MPISDEQVSRELAALRDIFAEFRAEMRTTLSGFVRTDVYNAQQETWRTTMAAQEQFYKAQLDNLRNEVNTLKGSLETLHNDRRQVRNTSWSAIASAGVALFVSIFKFH